MKFYLCQTAEGPRLAGNQVDAKALDKNFETVEWATDKDALMTRFNDMFAQIAAAGSAATTEPVVFDEEEPAQEPVEAPVSRKKAKEAPVGLDWQSAPEPGSCKRCVAMSAAARQIEGIMAVTNIEHAIYSSNDKAFLRKIDEALELRAEEMRAAA